MPERAKLELITRLGFRRTRDEGSELVSWRHSLNTCSVYILEREFWPIPKKRTNRQGEFSRRMAFRLLRRAELLPRS